MGMEEQLTAVTPIDGRYADQMGALPEMVSEFALIRNRVAVETGWLATLASANLPEYDSPGDRAIDLLDEIPRGFTVADAVAVKEIEATTRHDVKAVELWLKERLANNPVFGNYTELIHMGCTSEDINNLAYAMMMRDTRDKVVVPGLTAIQDDVTSKAHEYADIPMLARTHGQPATPTTLGKEMAVFSDRLARSVWRIGETAILGKFNGASGNYNAISFAYPEIDWMDISRRFVKHLGFTFNGVTTQIEPHDWMAELFDNVSLSNTVLIDLARDMWAYISNGTFKQQVVAGEVGSSTMPHKVNPINFENAEGNLGPANALFIHLAGKLPVSRLQRDLSDSTALRTVGEAFGHTHIAHRSILQGLRKVSPDKKRIAEELDDHWEVLTEAVQTLLRRHNVPGGYDALKDASRGETFGQVDYLRFVAGLELSRPERERLLALTPATYIGHAALIATRATTVA